MSKDFSKAIDHFMDEYGQNVDYKKIVIKNENFDNLKSSRDKKRYKLNGKNYPLKKRELVNETVKFVASLGKTFEELKGLFPDFLQGSRKVIVSDDEIKFLSDSEKNKRYYLNEEKIIYINGISYYTSKDWDDTNINKFINYVNKNLNEYNVLIEVMGE